MALGTVHKGLEMNLKRTGVTTKGFTGCTSELLQIQNPNIAIKGGRTGQTRGMALGFFLYEQ